MKKQQVLSRFFTAKPVSTSSGATQNTRLPRQDSVEPPARRGKAEAAPAATLPRRAPLNSKNESSSRVPKKRSMNARHDEENLESRPLKRRAPLFRRGSNDRFERVSSVNESDPEILQQTDDQFLEADESHPEILQTDDHLEENDSVVRSGASFVSEDVPDCLHLSSTGDNGSEGTLDIPKGPQKPKPIAKRSAVEDLVKGIPPSDPVKHKHFVEKLLARAEVNGEVKGAWYGTPPSGKEKFTPLELQVVELKAKFPDVVLMIEVGYRYRFFGNDAETAAKTLGIVAYYDHNFLTASIPTFRLHVHVRRLVAAGLKVGVVRQTETAAIKAHGSNKTGPFTRGLSALYTRATLEAAEDLGGTEDSISRLSSYLMCIAEKLVPVGKQKMKGAGSEEAKESGRVGDGNFDTEFGVVAVETATGDVMFGKFKDTVVRSELEGRLLTCAPAELLLASPLSSTTEKLLVDFVGPASEVRVERVSRDCFNDGGALAEVLDFYTIKGSHEKPDVEEGEGINEGLEAVLAMPDLVVQALALALRYLKQFNLERVLKFSSVFRPFSGLNEMNLSPNSLRQLEILKNNSDGSEKGSLLWLMDHTKTAFGARLLRYWVTHPLCDHTLIAARLDAVTEIAQSMGSSGVPQIEGTFPGSGKGGGTAGAASRGQIAGGASLQQDLLGGMLSTMGKMPDLERGITRIFHRTATTAEFVSVIQALITAAKHIQRLRFQEEEVNDMMECESEEKSGQTLNSPLLQRLIATVSSAAICEHAPQLLSALNTDAAAAGDKLNLFNCKDGRFPEVAKCREGIRAAEKELDSYLPQFRRLLRLPNLQYISLNGVSHIVEAPIAQRVPENWLKLNNTKKYQRYHPPEVLETSDKLVLAQEQLAAASAMAWDTFLAEFSSYYVDFRASVQALASLDCLHSLAVVSRNQGYTRPEFVEESMPSQLMIESGRHPILDSTLQDAFVPNDTFLGGLNERCQIITGPNMGGKSCYIRQVALISIMAQVGSYVPASSAKLHAFDSVQTRMGASDCLQKGSSTFFEELSETSTILRTATSRSLVILDELGRGTSTHDGVAIAYASLQYLLKETCCLTLFVTHYPKIVELKDEFPGEINPFYVSYLAHESNTSTDSGSSAGDSATIGQDSSDAAQTITFLYKLVPGVASKSFGLHVARVAQIPEACILRASTMATKFEKAVNNWRNNSIGAAAACNVAGATTDLVALDKEDCTKSPADCLDQDKVDVEESRGLSESRQTVTRSTESMVEPQSRSETSSTIDFRDGDPWKESGKYTDDESGVQELLLLIRKTCSGAGDSEKNLSFLKDIQQHVRGYLNIDNEKVPQIL